jgi:hypothetical protein
MMEAASTSDVRPARARRTLIFAGVFGVARSGVAAMFLFSHPWTAVLMTTSGLACLSRLRLGVRGALRLAGGREMEDFR